MIEERQIRAPVSRLHALELPPEEPIDVRRYVNALRRSRVLIAAIVIGLTGLVLLLSLLLPKTYTAQATILFDEAPSVASTTDAERQLATIQKLLMTRDVLALSARKLKTRWRRSSRRCRRRSTRTPTSSASRPPPRPRRPRPPLQTRLQRRSSRGSGRSKWRACRPQRRAWRTPSSDSLALAGGRPRSRCSGAAERAQRHRGDSRERAPARRRRTSPDEADLAASGPERGLRVRRARSSSPFWLRSGASESRRAWRTPRPGAPQRRADRDPDPERGPRRGRRRCRAGGLRHPGRGGRSPASSAASEGAAREQPARRQGQGAGDGRAEPCPRAVGRDGARHRCRPSPAVARAALRNGTRTGARRDPRRGAARRRRDRREHDRRAPGFRLVTPPYRHPGRSRSRRGGLPFTRLRGRPRGSVRRAGRIGVY